MPTKTILFDGKPMTKQMLEELAAEASRAAERFEDIWRRQKVGGTTSGSVQQDSEDRTPQSPHT